MEDEVGLSELHYVGQMGIIYAPNRIIPVHDFISVDSGNEH